MSEMEHVLARLREVELPKVSAGELGELSSRGEGPDAVWADVIVYNSDSLLVELKCRKVHILWICRICNTILKRVNRGVESYSNSVRLQVSAWHWMHAGRRQPHQLVLNLLNISLLL